MPVLFIMRRPVRRKYAAKASHGPRGGQGKMAHPYSISKLFIKSYFYDKNEIIRGKMRKNEYNRVCMDK